MSDDDVLRPLWAELVESGSFLATHLAYCVSAASREMGGVVTVSFEVYRDGRWYPKDHQ